VTDQELFEGIARKDDRAFSYLYQQQQERILRLVRQHNGTAEDARDVFQEGLIALWSNIAAGKFELREGARLSTYLYALCRNRWISRLRQRKPVASLDDNPQLEPAAEVEELGAHYERVATLQQHFRQLGEQCRRLLALFYYQKTSLREIAAELDITEASAKNQKYRCMQRLKAFYDQEKG